MSLTYLELILTAVLAVLFGSAIRWLPGLKARLENREPSEPDPMVDQHLSDLKRRKDQNDATKDALMAKADLHAERSRTASIRAQKEASSLLGIADDESFASEFNHRRTSRKDTVVDRRAVSKARLRDSSDPD